MAKACNVLGLAMLILAMTACPSLAYTFDLTYPASISGNMHSDQGSSGVEYNLKWQTVTLDGGATNWWFGLDQFDLRDALGGLDAVSGGTYNASGSIQFTVASGKSNLENFYYDDYDPNQTSLGMTGTFKLDSIVFSNDGFNLTLVGTLDVADVYSLDFADMSNSIPLAITVSKVSSNTPGQNSFIEKYSDYVKGGSGEVNFKGNDGGSAAAPEPASMLLFGSGLAGMAAWRRWRRRRKI